MGAGDASRIGTYQAARDAVVAGQTIGEHIAGGVACVDGCRISAHQTTHISDAFNTAGCVAIGD